MYGPSAVLPFPHHAGDPGGLWSGTYLYCASTLLEARDLKARGKMIAFV